MKNNASFVRKIIYLVTMAALLVPLYLISAPSFLGPDGERSEGGKLTQLREEYGLSQANLGEIDPASESMKLATLGMRGVAANLLWERANQYKKREEWDNLRATLNQIAKLQPNFISVWQFQAWNLSYNVSVEFDNYEHRYHWVKKGIEFLMQGIRYNRNEPRLLADLGWFFGHKFGRSDEYVQFRKKYNTDEDFHQSLEGQIDVEESKDYKSQPDNWLTAHQWYNEAQRVVDLEGVPIRGKNPLVFHSDSAKALIRYADAIENEGIFGEVARIAWVKAHNRWRQYGNREIPTSYGYKIRLNEGERWHELVGERAAMLEDLAPGVRERLEAERFANLTPEEKRLLHADRAPLDAKDYEVAIGAEEKMNVSPADIIAAIEDPAKRREAKLMSNRIVEAGAYSTTIRRYRDVVNFIYWRTRCEVEQQDRAIEARENLWSANELHEEADLIGAMEKYEEAWKRWASIHNEYPVLAEDVTAEDLVDQIKRYRKLLDQLELDFPPPKFPMLRLVANYADDFGFTNEEAQQLLNQADQDDAARETGQSESQDSSSNDSAEVAKETQPPILSDVDEDDVVDNTAENTDDTEPETASDTPTTPPSFSDLLDTAEAAYLDADLESAKDSYEAAWKSWTADAMSTDDGQRVLIKHVRQYRVLLGQLDLAFPAADFPLADFVKENAADFGYSDEEAAQLFSN